MPELPEVETIRRGLNKKIIGKKIAQVLVGKKVVEGSVAKFSKTLTGNSFKKIDRIGKLLIFELAKSPPSPRAAGLRRGEGRLWLLIHLKMTGQLIYQGRSGLVAGGHLLTDEDTEKLPGKYTRLQFHFAGRAKLFFNDLRRFGYMKLVDEKARQAALAKFGIEPLRPTFTLANFKRTLGKRKAPVKSVLMNQQLIAGIGNIYADEICFAAGVLPQKGANKLSEKEVKKLWQSCNQIIKQAIKGKGTTFKDYRDHDGGRGNFTKLLKVYGRAGEKCRRCRGKISKTKIAGRTTAYCQNCQI